MFFDKNKVAFGDNTLAQSPDITSRECLSDYIKEHITAKPQTKVN